MAFTLTSPSFAAGEMIPALHTCDGPGMSPALAWSDPPRGTKSLALLLEDPDARDESGKHLAFAHWVLYNIPTEAKDLSLGAGSGGELPTGAVEARNETGRAGYFAPCPSEGRHRYVFRLYALDSVLRARSAVTREELVAAIARHVLATAELVALYARQANSSREAPMPT